MFSLSLSIYKIYLSNRSLSFSLSLISIFLFLFNRLRNPLAEANDYL